MRFVSVATALSLSGLFAISAACSVSNPTDGWAEAFADAGAQSTSPTDPTGGTNNGTTTGGTVCEQLCANAASAKCAKQSTCVADCEADLKKIPAACKDEADAANQCARAKSIVWECGSNGRAKVAGGCDAEGNALVQCVLGGGNGGVDAGVDSGPSTAACQDITSGVPACDTCLQGSCCAQSAACAGNAACLDLLECTGACTTNACITECETMHPAGKAGFQALISCVGNNCNAECQ